MQLTETATFACPIDVLFSYVEEPEKQKLWMHGLLSNEPTSPGKKGLGSTFRMKMQEGKKVGEYDGEVTAHDRPHRLEVVIWGGNLPAGVRVRADYRFSEAAGQTKLDYACTMEGHKGGLFLWFMRLMMRMFGRRQVRAYFRELKKHAEAPQAA